MASGPVRPGRSCGRTGSGTGKGFFDWLESKSYKMHVRVLLARYRTYTTLPGLPRRTLPARDAEFPLRRTRRCRNSWRLPVADLLRLIGSSHADRDRRRFHGGDAALAKSARACGYLAEVGLGYLTLDRPTRTLSGGELERVNLTTCLGASLVNTLFVLDEPSVGLHPRDTGRLIRVMQRLRDKGNTLLVVEHEEAVIRAADHLVELGPGRGEAGGELVFAGPLPSCLRPGKP